MDERTLKHWMIERNLTVLEGSADERIETFEKVMAYVLPRKTVSDRTCHKNIIRWMRRAFLTSGWTPNALMPRFIDALLEATGPTVRNPNAVFITILKKEFGYACGKA